MRRSRLPPLCAPAEGGGSTAPALPSASLQTGTLFVVSLPIGDPEDISLRALRVLQDVRLIVVENARFAHSILSSYAITTETVSLQPRHGTPALQAALIHLKAGHDVALVADSGTPVVVDPGLGLIQAALRQNHRITAVPGATACMAALVLSGLSPVPFSFLGFPPRSQPERAVFFAGLTASRETAILYESCRYLLSTLSELNQILENDRKIVVACDLTHTKESVFRGTISEALADLAGKTPKGAYTLVISGKPSSIAPANSPFLPSKTTI